MNKSLKFFLFTSFIAFPLLFMGFKQSQKTTDMPAWINNDYAKQWQEIEKQENEGLPKSALGLVEKLYKKAKKDENAPQVVKTLIYRIKYTSQLEEEGMVKAIANIQEEVSTANFPEKQVLQSMLGQLYQSYLDNNYWKFSDRTNTTDFQSDDIQTWTIEQLQKASSEQFLASTKETRLSEIELPDFAAILNKGENSENLWPSLYDLLAHRAINHFSNERNYLTEPVYQFNIKEEKAFAPVSEFVQAKFETKDSTSAKWHTLKLFQEVLAKHAYTTDPAVGIDANLKRLKFVHNNAVNLPKDSLFLNALEQLYQKHKEHNSAAEIQYENANLIYRIGQTYQNGEEKNQFKFKEALEICQQTIKDYPNSFGAKNCQVLATNIQQSNFSLYGEQVYLPNQPILAKVEYQNVFEVFLKIIPLTEADREKLNALRSNEKVEWLNKQKSIREWSQELPKTEDYRSHSVELILEGLPLGFYAVAISDNNKFKENQGAVGHLITTVSNLGHLSRNNEEGNAEFLVVDRKNGSPLAGVKAEFYGREYNRRARKSELKKIGVATSLNNGFITPLLPSNQYFQVKFSKGKDVLFFNDGYSNYNRTRSKGQDQVTHLFLDRAIYRPGQTVYFKALVLSKNDETQPMIMANQKVEITLLDVNYQEVEKMELVTNDYGTAHGSFQIPKGGLTGRMMLRTNTNQTKQFRVEEYKRPKFEVTFDALDGTPQLNEEVSLKGMAKAFAGNVIDGAQVKYRVVREVQYPWYFRGYFPRRGSSMEITNGLIETDEEGKFELSFKAIPDENVSGRSKPMFVYTLYADVTDISGETRSGSKSVRIGSLGLLLSAVVPNIVDKGHTGFKINSRNLDGNDQATEVDATIYQLDAPKQSFLSRYWTQADQFLYDQETFKKSFPRFAYGEEQKKSNWKEVTEQLSDALNTGEQQDLVLDMKNWPVGEYKLVLKAKDNAGRDVEHVAFFTLIGEENQELAPSVPFWSKMNQKSFEPGEQSILKLGTSETQLSVLTEIEHEGKIKTSKWTTLNQWASLDKMVGEEHRGNFFWLLTYVKDNRFYKNQIKIDVPWTNKELKIELSSFRDKVLPGADEEWQIKISGPKKEVVAAEMLATMYDASLDAFVGHNWRLNPYNVFLYPRYGWTPKHFSSTNAYINFNDEYWSRPISAYKSYPSLNWFGYNFRGGFGGVVARSYDALELSAANVTSESAPRKSAKQKSAPTTVSKFGTEEGNVEEDAAAPPPPPPPPAEAEPQADLSDVPVRTNLNETVFFLPNLQTDEDGNVIIKFKMNEALTRWKFLGLAHTKDLKFGQLQQEIVTQKDLMVQPNSPRFVREGDEIIYTAKVSNLTDTVMNGFAQLLLFDATTNQSVDDLFANTTNQVNFTAEAGQSDALSWTLKVPEGKVPVLSHRVIAKAGAFADGEESAIPVLTNKMLVTETMPLPLNGKETKTFVFNRMKELGNSNTLQNHRYTLEFTSNPAWYAVQALPYLMEYPYDCSEQIFNRFYANSLATSVANSHPEIKNIFDSWKNTDALQSNLTKNEELKSLLIKETPWVMDAQSEAEQKKNIGLLFDLNRMADEQAITLNKLKDRQSANGGFSWFPGGRESWYITQYIVEGLGHLDYLGVKQIKENQTAQNLTREAIQYIDDEVLEKYRELERSVKQGKAKWKDDHLNHLTIHYLYARSFFPDIELPQDNQKAVEYYQSQAEKYWLKKGLYQQGLITLALHRAGKKATTDKIIASLKERALHSEELGMYWKYNTGYYWYQLPIETHSLLTEVFAEVAKDETAVNSLKQWLLKHKQTNAWKTTKATSAAVYALLSYGDNWILENEAAEITFPKAKRKYAKQVAKAQEGAEPGTGYFKMTWEGKDIDADLTSIKVENPNKGIAWGGIYWQYFEQLDKITSFEETPLQLKKQLFKEVSSDRGPKLEALSNSVSLKPGDKIMVRIELSVDRDMEYVHMKDMRASGLEPINVLSRYKWQGGLGYYESTGDAATNFFFSRLPKGTYVFEYPLRVFHQGDFSNGTTTIQCMYAPEFTSHAQGERILVKEE